VLRVVFLWCLRGEMCGAGGQEDGVYVGVQFSHFLRIYFGEEFEFKQMLGSDWGIWLMGSGGAWVRSD
jgi:hypothetical protein